MTPSRLLRWSAIAGVLCGAGLLGSQRNVRDDVDAGVAHASPPLNTYDLDQDGLADEVEKYLGTLPDQGDTDGDGYQDGEEFARHSDPLDMGSVPQSEEVGVAMAIYQVGNKLRPVIAVYAEDGDTRGTNLVMGVRVKNWTRNLPLQFFSKGAKVVSAPTIDPVAKVTIYDGSMKASTVKRFGSISLYGTAAYRGTIVSADALNLFDVNGVVVSRFMSNSGGGGGSGSQNNGPFTPGVMGTGAYKPLTPSGQAPPASWAGGQVCSQSMITAGVVGAVVTQEVVSASCANGWDSYCDGAACAGTVGSTVRVVDPLALIGG